ncbi:EVE domain-containing protein [Devosia sp.]|uniref:EVE domain-containing protein n=1 Tax=Devosia sp. TaxID=1871048 RepID=UPI001B296D03|nr:EVE domain-containing protein [Devosia sp.]MBO9587770.1 EVE domain-containing protein [Devosia sp.]
MTKYWIAVASAEHARRGKVGFMQVNHGKKTPLQRIRAGDGVTYYSPAETIRGKDRLQSFTTIGRVQDEDLYQGEMGGDFIPWRRNVDYVDAREAPIAPLLDCLDFTRGNRNWGYKMRLGLFEISEHDFRAIANAMQADI